jgi:TonB-linked SusC/RagA family outer membrane protein
LCLCCFSIAAFSQGRSISGVVSDASGSTVPGASVVIKGTTTGTVTNIDGQFSLVVPGNEAVLIISSLGYQKKEITVGQQTTLSVTLLEDVQMLEDVVVVGYGTQKKATLTGAVSQVKGGEMTTTKNENVGNMLTGKLAGVRSIQRTSEPGEYRSEIDIRGMGAPLYVIDGIPRDEATFKRLDANDIENLSVLKDATAAIYGVRAANGVILITTRKGSQTYQKPEVNYSGSYTMQFPSGFPKTVGVDDFFTMWDEHDMHRLTGQTLYIDRVNVDGKMDKLLNGEIPATDWYDVLFNKYAQQTMHNLNVSGSTGRTGYYLGTGYQYQDSYYGEGPHDASKINLRSNISTKINDRLTVELNLSGIIDDYDHLYYSPEDIYYRYLNMTPYDVPFTEDGRRQGPWNWDFPVLQYSTAEQSGYKKNRNKWFQSSASVKYDIPGIQGLSAKYLIGYDFKTQDYTDYKKAFYFFRPDVQRDQLWNNPTSITRQNYNNDQLMSQVSLSFDRLFGKHAVSALAAFETQKRNGDNFGAKRELTLPLDYLFAGNSLNQQALMSTSDSQLYMTSNNAVIGKVNYTYSEKYLLEGMFRYDGSSKFAKGHQWGFFPAVSAGWRISEEDFFKNSSLSFIEQLKLRTSYGVLGDDGASSYQWATGYTYPSSGNYQTNMTGGYTFDGTYVVGAANKGLPNTMITWYEAKTFNAGFDFSAWRGLLGVTAEYFNRERSGLLGTRSGSLPTVVGANMSQENLNGDRNFGFEVELSHRNTVGDVRYGLKGLFSIARTEILHNEHAPYGDSYDNWRNNSDHRFRNQYPDVNGNNGGSGGQNFTYGDAGQFTSWEEIWNYPIVIDRSSLLGDYKYVDWNGDGVIDGNDLRPARYGSSAWTNFSLIADASWKGFDLQLLFQGAAMVKYTYRDMLANAFPANQTYSNVPAFFLDRWHPVEPQVDPYDPANAWVSGYYAMPGIFMNGNSEKANANAKYLRLKNVELGYTIPFNKYISGLRVFVNAYNMLTFTGLRGVDPEHIDDYSGNRYPMSKTVTFGLNVKF